jgi:uncharacterized membrane protein
MGCWGVAVSSSIVLLSAERKATMLDWISENFWIFAGLMVVLLAALIGLLLFLRNRRTDD